MIDNDFVKYIIAPYTRGLGVEVGVEQPTYRHFTCVMEDSPLWLRDPMKLKPFAEKSLNYVFAHKFYSDLSPEDRIIALKRWWGRIKKDGHLCVFHEEPIEPPFEGFDQVVCEQWLEGFIQIWKKTDSGKRFSWVNKPEKTICITRFGAFGDMLQLSAVLPAVKRAGFHVTINTTPTGKEMLEHDPHVDAWMILDKDQVPIGELPAFSYTQSKRFTRYINLSESVECTYLATNHRPNAFWHPDYYNSEMDKNYMEMTALMLGVPYQPEGKFYPTKGEAEWAREFKAKLPGKMVLWALAGSSFHKVWPHMDAGFARILMYDKQVSIVTVGDGDCKLLEYPWENEQRVVRLSGEISIRKTMALAQIADMVVGPETGVLNSVAFEDMPKIVFLSHSSVNNLTRDWINTISLAPPSEKCYCYPCHRLFFGSDLCNKKEAPGKPEDGVSLCQAEITPDMFWAAYSEASVAWREQTAVTLV